MKLKQTFGALLLAVGLSTGAQAADYSAPYSPSFDWEGFYAGVGVSGTSYSVVFFNTPSLRFGEIDGVLGVNFMPAADWVLGAEIFGGLSRSLDFNFTSGVIGGEVRGGYLVTPEALMYVSAGAVHYFNIPITFGTVGAGVEFAVTDDISLDLEYKLQWNFPVYGHQVGASVLWHF
jgi:outer membrane immunogenic protein